LSCTGLNEDFAKVNEIGHYPQQKVVGNTHEQNRKILRDKIVDLFKTEQAGTGNKENSTRIIYCVEQAGDEIIYLQRPARLNKGFDFTVNTKNYIFRAPTEKQPHRKTKTPSHKSIDILLQMIKQESIEDFELVKNAIREIYLCSDQDSIDLSNLSKHSVDGFAIEALLKVIKWLFVEQDITYWSFSGRAMLYDGLKNA
jgi:hypothetical protein